MTSTVSRWAPIEEFLSDVLRHSEEYMRQKGAAHQALADQSVAAVRDVMANLGVDLLDRDELMGRGRRRLPRANHRVGTGERGLFDGGQTYAVQVCAAEVAAIVARLVPAPRRRWILEFEERPFTLNGERKSSRFTRAADVRRWRDAFHVLAKAQRIPSLGRIAVEVRPLFKNRRSMQDVAGCAPAAKAAIDGLVDAGVIPDDSPDHLIGQLYRPASVDGGRRSDALQLIVIEQEAGPWA